MWPNQPAAPPAASAKTTNKPARDAGMLAAAALAAAAGLRELAPCARLRLLGCVFTGGTLSGELSVSSSVSLSSTSDFLSSCSLMGRATCARLPRSAISTCRKAARLHCRSEQTPESQGDVQPVAGAISG